MDLGLLQAVLQRLDRHQQTVAESGLFAATVQALAAAQFTRIHCLALGRPALEFQALYQLAFLKALAHAFGIAPGRVLVFDPVFDANDSHLLVSVLGYRVADVLPADDSHCTLYYMPHAPRSVTDRFLATIKPRWVLGNDVTVTMGTLGKVRFLAEYPTLATLVHLAEAEKGEGEGEQPKQGKAEGEGGDGFQVARPRRRGKRKNVYVEPACVYDLALMYFDRVSVERLASPPNAPWKDSFSDLALNTIATKPRET